MWVSFRRRNIPVLRNSLARCNARHLRIKHLVQFILVDPVCNNALTNRAALLCRALRRVNRLCSSTVSGTANMSRHGSTLCSPTVEKLLCRSLFSERSHVGNLRQTLQGKRGENQRVETAGVYPLAHAAGRGDVPTVHRRRNPPLDFKRKTSRPLGANTPAAVRVPRSAGAGKSCSQYSR